MWTEARASVLLELGLLRRLLAENRELLGQAADAEPGRIEVMAISAVVHSFYGGVENVFRRIAKEIDGTLPAGEKWHTDLLARMSEASGKRPAVISAELRKRLTEYMYFRHVFRNIYTIDLDWDKMSGLARNCEETLSLFASEVQGFFADNEGT